MTSGRGQEMRGGGEGNVTVIDIDHFYSLALEAAFMATLVEWLAFLRS